MIETKKVLINCDLHGERTLTHHKLDDEWLGSQICDLCREESARAADERKANRQKELALAAREAEVKGMVGRAGIPPRFANKHFCDYTCQSEDQRRVLNICKQYAEEFTLHEKSGRSLVLAGAMGTGKTHLACAIANYIMLEHRRSALYVRTSHAMRMVKSTYSNTSEISTDKAISKLITPDLLILDEVGAQFGSSAEQNIFLEIIDGRYEQAKPTILLSNLNAGELQKFATPQAIDRLLEAGGRLVTFTWGSARPTLTHAVAH